MRIIVHGAAGRMGRKICDLLHEAEDLDLVGLVDAVFAGDASADPPTRGAETISNRLDACPRADLIIDFSSDSGTAAAADAAAKRRVALLVATTALSEETREKLHAAARAVPVLLAANTSIGATLLASLTERAALDLGGEADAAIIETHRRGKRDAPSGTALMLAEVLARAGCALLPHQILSIRSGDMPGEHIVRFAWEGEMLELRHTVNSRAVFAIGAVRAGLWLVGQAPGLYSMADFLARPAR